MFDAPAFAMRIPLLAALLLQATLAEEPETASLPDPDEAAYPAIERFIKVMEQVRQRHPDTDQLAYQRLVNHALEGMLASLDPFSSFIHPEMARALEENPQLDPHLPSLGLTLGWRDDGPYLANVLPASPAARAGLLPGSRLIEIDDRKLKDLSPAEVIPLLRKPAGQTTTVLVDSPAAPQQEQAELTHRAVRTRAVTHSHLLGDVEPATGYLRLASFSQSSPREVEAALDDLEDSGMKRLILDLRGNPGGSLPATVRILGLLLPPATVVVTTRGRGEEKAETLTTPDRQRRTRDYPVSVLIDRHSASASELTAGALQDLERATIVGETSYGKGSVQNILPMGGGTALRLTVATYHTPSGRTPHLQGVTPDIIVETTDSTRELVLLSSRRDSLTPEEAARLEGWTDPVLKAALDSSD